MEIKYSLSLVCKLFYDYYKLTPLDYCDEELVENWQCRRLSTLGRFFDCDDAFFEIDRPYNFHSIKNKEFVSRPETFNFNKDHDLITFHLVYQFIKFTFYEHLTFAPYKIKKRLKKMRRVISQHILNNIANYLLVGGCWTSFLLTYEKLLPKLLKYAELKNMSEHSFVTVFNWNIPFTDSYHLPFVPGAVYTNAVIILTHCLIRYLTEIHPKYKTVGSKDIPFRSIEFAHEYFILSINDDDDMDNMDEIHLNEKIMSTFECLSGELFRVLASSFASGHDTVLKYFCKHPIGQKEFQKLIYFYFKDDEESFRKFVSTFYCQFFNKETYDCLFPKLMEWVYNTKTMEEWLLSLNTKCKQKIN